VLLLQDNYEPSWVLERSLARKRRKVCTVLIIVDAVNDFHPSVEKWALKIFLVKLFGGTDGVGRSQAGRSTS